MRVEIVAVLIPTRQCPISLCVLAAGLLFLPVAVRAQGNTAPESAASKPSAVSNTTAPEQRPAFLPPAVTKDNFSVLSKHSPFVRTLNVSRSLILTGIAQIEEETVATMLDLETRQTYTLSQGKVSQEGWQLVEVKGDPSDVETLTAKIKVGGAEIVSIRYEKSPPPTKKRSTAMVSYRVGNGTSGGGTGPHGGPDPRVLTPDQLADARKGARNIKGGFQADGYADNQAIPTEVVNKLSRLSSQQRERINVKMYEYRNRGLGMKERQQIYNKLLDKEVGGR